MREASLPRIGVELILELKTAVCLYVRPTMGCMESTVFPSSKTSRSKSRFLPEHPGSPSPGSIAATAPDWPWCGLRGSAPQKPPGHEDNGPRAAPGWTRDLVIARHLLYPEFTGIAAGSACGVPSCGNPLQGKGTMNAKLIASLILIGLIILFTFQNTQVVELRFLFWSLSMSSSLMVYVILAMGIAAGWMLCSLPRSRKGTDATPEDTSGNLKRHP